MGQQQENNTNEANVPETVPEVPNETENAEAEATGSAEEDELLMQALQMSLAQDGGENMEEEDGDEDDNAEIDLDNVDFSQLTEEQQIEFALQMSMREQQKENKENKDMKE